LKKLPKKLNVYFSTIDLINLLLWGWRGGYGEFFLDLTKEFIDFTVICFFLNPSLPFEGTNIFDSF